MAEKSLQLKKLGHHISASVDLLFDRLKLRSSSTSTTHDQDYGFPIIDRNLYSDDPWNILKDNDPWEISNNSEENKLRKRTIHVFTPVKRKGKKRFSRTAGTGKWEGSTGGKPVKRENGLVIGIDSYFEFKVDNDPAGNTDTIRGHWSMHECRLPSEDDWNHVVCKVTHVVDKALRIDCAWPKTTLDICFDYFKNWGLFMKKQQLDDRDQEVEEYVRNKWVKQETADEDERYAYELVDMLIENNDGVEETNQPVVHDESGAVLTNTSSNENPGREVVTTQAEVNDMDDLIDWNWIDGEDLMEPLNESGAVLTNTSSNENPSREVLTTQPEINDMDDVIDWNWIDGEDLMEPLNESGAVLTNTSSNENPSREVLTTQPEINDMDDVIDWNRIDGEDLMEPLNELNSSEEQLSISFEDIMERFGDNQVAGSSKISKNEYSVMEVNVHDRDDVYGGLEDIVKLDEPPNYSLDGQSLRFEQDLQLQDNLWSNEDRLLVQSRISLS